MRSGIVSVVGRPNVGKSSLVNALAGRKVSIVTHKPQTTRHRIQGVLNGPDGQAVLVDTPGLHRTAGRALNRYLNEQAAASLSDVDLVLFVIDAGRWTDEDQAVLERLARVPAPVGLVLNKVDRITPRERLLPELERRRGDRDYVFVMPVSALKGDNVARLAQELLQRMPEGPALYPEGQVEGHDQTFALAEIVREKLMSRLHQELPYSLTVQIETLGHEKNLTRVEAAIWIERESQKAIVIGKGGAVLKAVGSAARREMEKRLGHKVFIKLRVAVRAGWTDDPAELKRLGYT